jgi:hypothetical protein
MFIVNDIGTPIPNPRLVQKLRALFIILVSLFKLYSIAGKTKRIISNSTEEISSFNKLLSLSKKYKNIYKRLLVINNTIRNKLLFLTLKL